ncbi:MAG: PKD domain-containing protein [Salinivirgaceae bacterium]|nr:PKD domain-containing protein [Salinivirgaceae bacterium]
MKKLLILTALIAAFLWNCDDSSTPTSIAPEACFTITPSEIYAGDTVFFTNCSKGGGSFSWIFGDEVTSTEKEPVHVYNIAGDYKVTLIQKNSRGTDSTSTSITVITTDLVACFTVSANEVEKEQLVTFTNCSYNAETYYWEFGDYSTSTLESPTHSYSQLGEYFVKLTVSRDNGNESESITDTINVVDEVEPTACFTVSATEASVGDNILFTNCSQNASSYEWDFKDETTSTETSPTHSFSEAGTYNVTLTAKNGENEDVETKTITITGEANEPIACFTMAPNPAEVYETITFTNCSQNATSYYWIFGDGGTSTETAPNHTYTEEGSYSVSLTAINGENTDVETKSISITGETNEPIACFTMTPNPAEVYEYVYFTNCSQNATSYQWDFDSDGSVDSEEANPYTYFYTAGTYTVKLTAINGSDVNIIQHELVVEQTMEMAWDFESFTDFAETFGDWIVEDRDGLESYGAEGFDFPTEGGYSWFIMNPSMVTGGEASEAWNARSGDKYACCMAAMPEEGYGNDDWLYSPARVIVSGYTVQFYAKSVTDAYGLEQMNVVVVDEDSGVETILNGSSTLSVPIYWTMYSFDLSDFAGQNVRIAIQDVSYDTFALFIDDFEIIADGGKSVFRMNFENSGNLNPKCIEKRVK